MTKKKSKSKKKTSSSKKSKNNHKIKTTTAATTTNNWVNEIRWIPVKESKTQQQQQQQQQEQQQQQQPSGCSIIPIGDHGNQVIENTNGSITTNQTIEHPQQDQQQNGRSIDSSTYTTSSSTIETTPTTTTVVPSISIISWNVLAEAYCSRRSHPNLPKQYQKNIFFHKNKRCEMICDILENTLLTATNNVDIICLQEVDMNEISKKLQLLGYTGILETPRSIRRKNQVSAGCRVDSCGIYINEKSSCWRIQNYEIIYLDDLATLSSSSTTTTTSNITNNHETGTKAATTTTAAIHDTTSVVTTPPSTSTSNPISSNIQGIQQSFLRRNVALLVRLYNIYNPKQTIIIVNAHLFWNPGYEYVKLCQAHYILQRAKQFSLLGKSTNNNNNLNNEPFIFCGDFNSRPWSITHSYLSYGKINAKLIAPWYSLHDNNYDKNGSNIQNNNKNNNNTNTDDTMITTTINQSSNDNSVNNEYNIHDISSRNDNNEPEKKDEYSTTSRESNNVDDNLSQLKEHDDDDADDDDDVDDGTVSSAIESTSTSEDNALCEGDTEDRLPTTSTNQNNDDDIISNLPESLDQLTLYKRKVQAQERLFTGPRTSSGSLISEDPMNPSSTFSRPRMKYILDATLNKFCRWLRILGLDAALETEQEEKMRTSEGRMILFERCYNENRTLVTTSTRLIQRRDCPASVYWISPQFLPKLEVALVHMLITHGVVLETKTFLTRCVICNGRIVPVESDSEKTRILAEYQAPTELLDDSMDVYECDGCKQGYWWCDRPTSSASRVKNTACELFELCLRAGIPCDRSCGNLPPGYSDGEEDIFEHVNEEELKKKGWDYSIRGSDLLRQQLDVIDWLKNEQLECPFRLESSYAAKDTDGDLVGECLPFTNVTSAFVGTLDYIFFDKNHLCSVDRLFVPTSFKKLNSHDIENGHLLPSDIWPSDHLAVGARLSFLASSDQKAGNLDKMNASDTNMLQIRNKSSTGAQNSIDSHTGTISAVEPRQGKLLQPEQGKLLGSVNGQITINTEQYELDPDSNANNMLPASIFSSQPEPKPRKSRKEGALVRLPPTTDLPEEQQGEDLVKKDKVSPSNASVSIATSTLQYPPLPNHNQRCQCGCVPMIPGLFEMAEMRKQAKLKNGQQDIK